CPAWPGWSACCYCWQADEGIIAQLSDAFQRHVAGTLNGPFIVLFEQQGSDETHDGVVIREDADDIGAPLDLPVKAFDRIRAVKLGPMLLREGHVGEHVGFGVVEDGGKLRHLRSDLDRKSTRLNSSHVKSSYAVFCLKKK